MCILSTKNLLQFTLVRGVKFWTQIFICVIFLTFYNSAMVSKAHIQLAVQAKWALGMGGRPKCWQEAIAPVPKPSMRRRHFRARSQADHQAPPGNGPRMQATPTIPTCTRPKRRARVAQITAGQNRWCTVIDPGVQVTPREPESQMARWLLIVAELNIHAFMILVLNKVRST